MGAVTEAAIHSLESLESLAPSEPHPFIFAVPQAKALKIDWKDPVNAPVKPKLLGNKTLIEFPIQDVVDYIDWNPFFQVSPVWMAPRTGG